MTQVATNGGLRELYGVVSRRRKVQLALLIGLMLIGALFELLTIGAVLPFLQLVVDPRPLLQLAPAQRLLDLFGWREASDLLLPAVLLLVALAVVSTLVRLLLTWCSQKFIYRLGYDLDMEIYRRIVHQPYALYVRRNSSEVLSGLEKVNNVVNWMLMPLMQAVISGVIAVFIILLLFLLEPVTALIATAFMGVLYGAVTFASRRQLRRITERFSALMTGRTKLVQETLGGFRDIVMDRSQPLFERKFGDMDLEFRDLSVTATFIANAPRFLVEGAGVALIGILAFYYSTQPGGVVQAVPVLGALALGAQRLMPLVQAVYVGRANYASSRQALRDVVGLLSTPVLPPGSAEASARRLSGAIEFRQIGFDYEAGSPALRDVDLSIKPGERVGLVGKTGSGKSTLVDLLMGLLEPSSGQIVIGGELLGNDNRRSWQAQIAHVPQAIFLADDSIAANIAFGASADEIDPERVRDAARRADIGAFIETLPRGYNTHVGERGVRLSGGQRQRIGIARALYKRAEVLILDEATSALDDATEASVMTAIEKLDRDLTIILIAHRTSTLAACDTVFRLEGGRVVQSGSFAEVIGGDADRVRAHLTGAAR